MSDSLVNLPLLPPSLLARIASRVGEERMEWYAMSPAARWAATGALWANFLALGGSLELELAQEQIRGKQADREYWAPLRTELEQMRHDHRRPGSP